jgi:hypothetical protein
MKILIFAGKIQIQISKPTGDAVKVVQNAAEKGNLTLDVPPVEFTVSGTYNNKTVDVSKFNAYDKITREQAMTIAASVSAGIIAGRDSATLAPQAYITRAEVAAMIQRLLQKSGLS